MLNSNEPSNEYLYKCLDMLHSNILAFSCRQNSLSNLMEEVQTIRDRSGNDGMNYFANNNADSLAERLQHTLNETDIMGNGRYSYEITFQEDLNSLKFAVSQTQERMKIADSFKIILDRYDIDENQTLNPNVIGNLKQLVSDHSLNNSKLKEKLNELLDKIIEEAKKSSKKLYRMN